MRLRVQRIEHPAVDQYWPDLEPLVIAACARSGGRYEAQHVLGFWRNGTWQCWVIYDERGLAFVGATEVLRYPTGLKTLAIRMGTGRGMKLWKHLMEDVLADAAASAGCRKAEGQFRKGWRRVLPGWAHTHDVLERDL